MIVPNKIATLEYAEKCRELLQTTTLHQIVNLSAANVFPALEVYPYIILWTKNRPATDHYLTYFEAHSVLELNSPRAVQTIRQTELHASQGWQFHGSLNVEARVKTAPLSSLATLHCGTPGFSAQQIAQALCEAGEQVGANVFDFIVSGNIDRYAVRLGNVRYMQRDFVRPVLPQAHPVLSANKRQLFAGAKIVIAGMTKRLEALLDPALLDHGSWALGVQVFAVANVQEDMRYVLGLLNSKLMSYLFRTRFHAKQLARGFLAINKGQLAQLPIRMIDGHQSAENAMYAELLQRVDRLLLLHASVDNNQAIAAEIAATDSQIDELVYRLYELTPTEIEQVEAGYVQGAEEQKRRSLIF